MTTKIDLNKLPNVELALEIRQRYLDKGNWVKLNMSQKEITLESGPMKSDGSREVKTVTLKFYDNDQYITYPHS